MPVYVFDSAPLSCFARARQLPILDRLTVDNDRVTTRAVVEEIENGVAAYPDLQDVLDLAWLRVVSADSLDELRLFAKYAARLGSGVHDVGEASVLAWAEAHAAIAFTDDEAAVQAGRDEGVEVRRTLAVVARGIKHGVLSDLEADRLVDELLRAGGQVDASRSAQGSSSSGPGRTGSCSFRNSRIANEPSVWRPVPRHFVPVVRAEAM